VTNRNLILSALAAAALVAGGSALTLPSLPVFAQAASPDQGAPPPPPARPRPPRERASHIEGRIAYLKTELKITPAQEQQFDKVALALRQNDTERRQGFEQMRAQRTAQPPQPPNALQGLEARARLAAMRAQQADRFLAAFRPLYDGMSDAQKKAADDLLAPRFGRRFGHHA
jgi:protein CpxP